MSLEGPLKCRGRENGAGRKLAADEAIVAMGANLPFEGAAPQVTLSRVLARLNETWNVVSRSSWWRTPAWPDPSEPAYVNGCVRLRGVAGSTSSVLSRLHDIEAAFGRSRSAANAARTLDLDLIDLGGRVESHAGGLLPHPRASNRAFVLLPLREVAPRWRHPDSGLAVADLLKSLPAQAFDGVQRLVSLHCEKDR